MTATSEVERVTSSQNLGTWFKKTVLAVPLLLTALFWLVPGLGLLITSFRPVDAANESGWWNVVTSPTELTLSNYIDTLGGDADILSAAWVSILISVPVTLLVVILASLAAYALSWVEFPGREKVFVAVVALLVVPLQMALVPSFQIFRGLGISGVPAIWLFHTAFGLPFAVFLLRNFMVQLPESLLDAARLDGAGELMIFRKIILPLSWPAIASLAIFQFTWTWNDLLVALVFSTDDKPLTVFLQGQLGAFSSGIAVISTGVFLSALVPVAVFLAFQKHFAAGLLGGAVK